MSSRLARLSHQSSSRGPQQQVGEKFGLEAVLDVLIVSEDRACRLDALLRSLSEHLKIPCRIHVYYSTTSADFERGYDALRVWHQGVRWIVATATPCLTLIDVVAGIAAGPGRFVLHLGDDTLMTRSFTDIGLIEQLDDDEELSAISLRLGDEIEADPAPPGERWLWDGLAGPWGEPNTLGGHVYRSQDLTRFFSRIRFTGLTGIEPALAELHVGRSAMLRGSQPAILRVNLLGGGTATDTGPSGPEEQAINQAFLAGFALDLRPMTQTKPGSCSLDSEPSLVPDSRPRRATTIDPVRDPWRPKQVESVQQVPGEHGLEIRVESGTQVHLNSPAQIIWDLCDGQSTTEEMLDSLQGQFESPKRQLERDLQQTLEHLVDAGLIGPARRNDALGAMRRVDLREIPTFVINCEMDTEKRCAIEAHLKDLGFNFEVISGLTATPSWFGVALSHLKVLRLSRAQVPFLVLEDDCVFFESFDPVIEFPAEADAVSLGLSVFGLETPGRFSWGRPGKVRTEPYTKSWLRTFNMLARHAVLYLSADYQDAIIESQVEALTNRKFPHMGDIGCAMAHASHIVLAPNDPICRQSIRESTAISLRADQASPPSDTRKMSVAAEETVPARDRIPSLRPTDPEVIASCLSHFQEVNKTRQECVVHHLGDRGFFAELTAVARGMIWAWVHQQRFVLDSSDFAYSVDKGWEDYFEPFCESPDDVDPATIVDRFEYQLTGERSAFNRMRAHQPTQIEIGGLLIGGSSRPFQEVLATFTNMIFRPNAAVRTTFAELQGTINLEGAYGAIHLRRGDKVGDEDVSYPAGLYLERVAPLADLDGLFVMSDAYVAVEEVRAELERLGRQIPVHSFVTADQSGFDIWKLRRGEHFMAHGEQEKSDNSDRSYMFAEIAQVLAEVDIAARSERFVSTFLSNVGRTVWFLHQQPEHCALLNEGEIAAWKPASLPESPGAAPAPVGRLKASGMSEVEILLSGGHHHRVELDQESPVLQNLLDLQAARWPEDELPVMVQVPLDGGRAALTFAPKNLVGLNIEARDDAARIVGKPAAQKPGHHRYMQAGEGHLGGYIQAQSDIPSFAHGDPWTWSPELFRWIVDTFEIGSVLDVGCGEGHAAGFFRGLGCEVLGIDGSIDAHKTSVIPDWQVVHDYQEGPFIPSQPFDLVWSCEFVEHVEEQFTQNFLATFASARKTVIMTFAAPDQPGWHHVNLQPRKYWINKVERLGFLFDQELTDEAKKHVSGARHLRRTLVFVRATEMSAHRLMAETDQSSSRSLEIHDMEITRHDGLDFFLFLDIFVHPSLTKIVAVAPFYGQDWDPAEEGVEHEKVDLILEGRRIRARYLPHRLDSWEPCILYEFEDPVLTAQLRERQEVGFTIEVGPHLKHFRLQTRLEPAYHVAMSLVVRNENRWIRHFLEYYLVCMGVDHVWVYDNGTGAKEELLSILRPYQERGQVTYIPWAYRWRNQKPSKMIGQPPQEAHSLNRFANSRWIGFFDVDELLRIPGVNLPDFLSPFERAEVDGLSFGLRWFVYQGPLEFERVGDPPLNYLHGYRDELGRKRQKLFVKPGEVRFLRLHTLEDGKRELPVDDTEIFFHHYSQRAYRFGQGKDADAEHDNYMLRFAGQLRLHGRSKRPATVEAWIEHIEQAFIIAEAETSALPPEVLELRGMCGTKTRHFYNALCAFEDCRFLEIGSWLGASACAVIAGNRVDAVCIDNWSQFDGNRAGFEANIDRWRGASDVKVLEGDCFELDISEIGPFDVFLYDGDHRRVSHRDAVLRYAPTFAGPAVLIVDDWNWERVREGTQEALEQLGLEVLYRKEIILPPEDLEDIPRHRGRLTWWNGIAVFLVS